MKILFALLAFAAAHAAGNLSEEQGADALQKELDGLNKQAEQVLQQVDRLPALPSLPAAAEQIDETRARALKLAGDEQFLKSANTLLTEMKGEKRKNLMIAQLVFLLFMVFFKSWRQSCASNWFHRGVVGLACSLITWAGMLYVIPLAVLGPSFGVFTGVLWRVLVMGQ